MALSCLHLHIQREAKTGSQCICGPPRRQTGRQHAGELHFHNQPIPRINLKQNSRCRLIYRVIPVAYSLYIVYTNHITETKSNMALMSKPYSRIYTTDATLYGYTAESTLTARVYRQRDTVSLTRLQRLKIGRSRPPLWPRPRPGKYSLSLPLSVSLFVLYQQAPGFAPLISDLRTFDVDGCRGGHVTGRGPIARARRLVKTFLRPSDWSARGRFLPTVCCGVADAQVEHISSGHGRVFGRKIGQVESFRCYCAVRYSASSAAGQWLATQCARTAEKLA